MLIVDFNALQTVDLLDLADQVILSGDAALDGQDVLRVGMADVYKRQRYGSSSRW